VKTVLILEMRRNISNLRCAVLSLLLAFGAAMLMLAMADKGHLSDSVILVLSPGYILGSLASEHVRGFGRSLQIFGWTAFSTNLLYSGAIFFGVLSILANRRK